MMTACFLDTNNTVLSEVALKIYEITKKSVRKRELVFDWVSKGISNVTSHHLLLSLAKNGMFFVASAKYGSFMPMHAL
jgi:hypothetical protein